MNSYPCTWKGLSPHHFCLNIHTRDREIALSHYWPCFNLPPYPPPSTALSLTIQAWCGQLYLQNQPVNPSDPSLSYTHSFLGSPSDLSSVVQSWGIHFPKPEMGTSARFALGPAQDNRACELTCVHMHPKSAQSWFLSGNFQLWGGNPFRKVSRSDRERLQMTKRSWFKCCLQTLVLTKQWFSLQQKFPRAH